MPSILPPACMNMYMMTDVRISFQVLQHSPRPPEPSTQRHALPHVLLAQLTAPVASPTVDCTVVRIYWNSRTPVQQRARRSSVGTGYCLSSCPMSYVQKCKWPTTKRHHTELTYVPAVRLSAGEARRGKQVPQCAVDSNPVHSISLYAA